MTEIYSSPPFYQISKGKRKDKLKMSVYLLIGYIFGGLGEFWFDTNITTLFCCKIAVFFTCQKLLRVPDGTTGNSSIMLEGYFCGENLSRNKFSRRYHRFIEVPRIKLRKVSLL
jgi:hypothetical protein